MGIKLCCPARVCLSACAIASRAHAFKIVAKMETSAEEDGHPSTSRIEKTHFLNRRNYHW